MTALNNQQLTEALGKTQESVQLLTKSVNEKVEKILSKTPAAGMPHPSQVFGLPNIRHGENPLTSRGFSFLKMLGMLTGQLAPDQAKIESDIHSRLHNVYVKSVGNSGYEYRGTGHAGSPGGKFLAPLATSFMHEEFVDRDFRHEMKSLVAAGTDRADLDEMRWLRGNKALSWLNDATGGALVAPPEQGELIELLRNKEALINAGARVVPLPPQGRLKYPRQTSASLAYWVGENAPISESIIGTGEVTLQAKKLAVLIKAPNELIRFASPAAEALMRDDMTKSLALGLDLAGLEGLGGDNRPLGLINHQNINQVASSAPGADGDSLVGQDVYRMISIIEENNAEFEGFIMRPKTMYAYYQLRSDAVAQNDKQGPFLFSMIREASADSPAMLSGYPVTKSTQISMSRSKGSATNLTYIAFGKWSEMLIGMFGAIEFAATTQGSDPFIYDQTWVRGILSSDIQLRYPAAFGWMDNIALNN